MTPEWEQDMRDVARQAAARLRDYAETTISSFYAPGLAIHQQDKYWDQGIADLDLAKKLGALARHGKRTAKRKASRA